MAKSIKVNGKIFHQISLKDDENKFEGIVSSEKDYIFPEQNSIYIDIRKFRIPLESGESRIPDALRIVNINKDFRKSILKLNENEIESHSFGDHIIPQIRGFSKAFTQNIEARIKIKEFLYDVICEDPNKVELFKSQGIEDIHKWISDFINYSHKENTFGITIIFDEKTRKNNTGAYLVDTEFNGEISPIPEIIIFEIYESDNGERVYCRDPENTIREKEASKPKKEAELTIVPKSLFNDLQENMTEKEIFTELGNSAKSILGSRFEIHPTTRYCAIYPIDWKKFTEYRSPIPPIHFEFQMADIVKKIVKTECHIEFKDKIKRDEIKILISKTDIKNFKGIRLDKTKNIYQTQQIPYKTAVSEMLDLVKNFEPYISNILNNYKDKK